MRIRRPYSLFKVTTKRHGQVWHVSYYGRDGMRRKESTGESNKAKAHTFAVNLLKKNALKKSITLKQFAETFFKWGECTWIKRQIAKGRGCNRQWATAKRGMLHPQGPELGDGCVTADGETWGRQ